jgi:hypothetical protein
MTSTQLYLPTLLPQWGIFAGVVLITIGYIDKKRIWTRLGWITLIITSLIALYFNLFGGLDVLTENEPTNAASLIISTGWQTAAGGILAIISLIMLKFNSKRYPLLAILALAYFILTFFLYSQISDSSEIKISK